MHVRIPAALACAGLILATQPASAALITLNAVADTTLTEDPALGGTTSVHGSDTVLYVDPFGGTTRSYPLIRFDLSAYAGQTVLGDATLTVQVAATEGSPSDLTFNIQTWNNVPWSEATASWDVPCGGLCVGGTIYSQSVSMTGAGTINFTGIPQAVVQSWILAPSANWGVLLRPSNANPGDDMLLFSRESGFGPALTFQTDAVEAAVPEPSTVGLIGAGLAALWAHRRRAASRRAP